MARSESVRHLESAGQVAEWRGFAALVLAVRDSPSKPLTRDAPQLSASRVACADADTDGSTDQPMLLSHITAALDTLG
jgi:hypothetical protein